MAVQKTKGKTISNDEKGLKGPPTALLDPAKRSSSWEECLHMMWNVAPLDAEQDRLVKLIGLLPKDMYLEGKSTFYSKPDESIADLRNALLMGEEFPKSIPEFCIDITSRGSNIFCIYANKAKKIVVMSSVRNIQSVGGSWASFVNYLERALDELKSSETKGKKVSFLIINEGHKSEVG